VPLEAFLYATFDRDLDLNKVKMFKDSKSQRENRVSTLCLKFARRKSLRSSHRLSSIGGRLSLRYRATRKRCASGKEVRKECLRNSSG
jgi:hypothetical protein